MRRTTLPPPGFSIRQRNPTSRFISRDRARRPYRPGSAERGRFRNPGADRFAGEGGWRHASPGETCRGCLQEISSFPTHLVSNLIGKGGSTSINFACLRPEVKCLVSLLDKADPSIGRGKEDDGADPCLMRAIVLSYAANEAHGRLAAVNDGCPRYVSKHASPSVYENL